MDYLKIFMVNGFVHIALGIVLGWLSISSLYLFVLALASWYKRQKNAPTALSVSNMPLTVVVPAYKNDAVLLDSCKNNIEILRQIGQLHFKYVVLADHVKAETAKLLEKMGAIVFPITLENPTKSRAINQWLQHIPNPEGLILLLDVDNTLEKKNLATAIALAQKCTNTWFQWQRTAANSNTEIASLDAWSEAVNNNIFRTGAQNISIRPSIIGSGMVALAADFKKMHQDIDVTGGFDKWLEHFLIQQKTPVSYLSWVSVKDQKTASKQALHKQRTRWVAAQYKTAKALLGTFVAAILTLRWLAALKYFQLYLPPRVLHLASSGLACGLWLYNYQWGLIATINFATLGLALLLATPRGMHRVVFKLVVKQGWSLVWSYLTMTTKFKEANKKFLVTEHKRNEENNSH